MMYHLIQVRRTENKTKKKRIFLHADQQKTLWASFDQLTCDCLYEQTCPGKDVRLHVAATNEAVILYQKLGFKPEEFIMDFYKKYYPDDNPICKHALLMRLRR